MPEQNEKTTAFITRGQGVTASELSTSQSFVIELCELLGVPRPRATAEQDCMFERPITFAHGDASAGCAQTVTFDAAAAKTAGMTLVA